MTTHGVGSARWALVVSALALGGTSAAADTATEGAATEDPWPVTLRSAGSDAVLILAGTFRMGSVELEIARTMALCELEPWSETCGQIVVPNELPAHDVYLSPYWIDRREVTVAAYGQCVRAGVCEAPPYPGGAERFERDSFPVTLVTWNDAQRFCAWVDKRLPTEAEWERAARGLEGRRFPWGNLYNPFLSNHGRLAFEVHDDEDGFFELAPVGSFPDGRTPDGLDDLAGNAEEWVYDYYADAYPEADAENPRGPDVGDERVVRGGSYITARPFLRASARSRARPSDRQPTRGFRCARDARP